MTIGLEQFRDPRELRLDRMLLQPFRGRVASWWSSADGWIEVDELAARLAGPGGVPVIDVRSAEEFDGPLGHIPGARLVPLAELGDHVTELRGIATHTLVVVCRTDKRSARAADRLRASGFGDVRVLRGGMERWNALREGSGDR
jgi:rhodanese-related sulfurtransferase